MHSDGHRLNHCCVFESEVIRHRINDVFGHYGVLGKAAMLAVVPAGHAQDTAVLAKIHLATPAKLAAAAGHH